MPATTRVTGSAGLDTLIGDSGNDTLSGGVDNDTIIARPADPGADTVNGDAGDDTCNGVTAEGDTLTGCGRSRRCRAHLECAALDRAPS